MSQRAHFDAVHINSTDAAASADWYRGHFGGRLTQSGAAFRLDVEGSQGEAAIVIHEMPSPGPSVGTTMDHFGWSVEDVEAAHRALLESGATEVSAPMHVGPENLHISFIVDPWGAKLELLADRELLGLHHVHLLGPDNESEQDWWARETGGTKGRYAGLLPAVQLERFWILFRASDDELDATRGRALDSIAFRGAAEDASLEGPGGVAVHFSSAEA